jgi:GTP-binding protein
MKIKYADFVISNSDYKKCPNNDLLEYAFIGRSNVGKSSLINSIVNKKNLAKTSSTPGKTQLINHYIINNSFYIVDLPGIGYAKTSKKARLQFKEMIESYLIKRSSLECLFMLIDCRHTPQTIDQKFMQWLAENEVPFVITFTKSDKLTKIQLKQNISLYKKEMLKEWIELPKIFITSSKTKTGIDEIKEFIQEIKSSSR